MDEYLENHLRHRIKELETERDEANAQWELGGQAIAENTAFRKVLEPMRDNSDKPLYGVDNLMGATWGISFLIGLLPLPFFLLFCRSGWLL